MTNRKESRAPTPTVSTAQAGKHDGHAESITIAARAKNTLARGVDLSSHNPVSDYDALADYADFAFLRASYAQTTDNLYPRHLHELHRRGVLTGPYHYLYPADPQKQAALFASIVWMSRECGSMLPAVLDVEQGGLTEYIVEAFIDVFYDLTREKPMIYTSKSRWSLCAGNAEWGRELPLWVAYWGAAPPLLPDPWSTWLFWQYGVAAAGTVPGVPGRCDVDYYRASAEQLRGDCQVDDPPPCGGPFVYRYTMTVTGVGDCTVGFEPEA